MCDLPPWIQCGEREEGKGESSQLFTTQQGAVGKEPHSASYGSMEKGHFCPAGLCK